MKNFRESSSAHGDGAMTVHSEPVRSQPGQTNTPEDGVQDGQTGSAAVAGASLAPRGKPQAETAGEHVRNALTILRIDPRTTVLTTDGYTTYEDEDIDAVRRRLELALEQIDVEGLSHRATQRTLQAATAEIARLNLAFRAPTPSAVVYAGRLQLDGHHWESFLVALSDGSLKRYIPDRERGKQWLDEGSVPDTRAALLAPAGQVGL